MQSLLLDPGDDYDFPCPTRLAGPVIAVIFTCVQVATNPLGPQSCMDRIGYCKTRIQSESRRTHLAINYDHPPTPAPRPRNDSEFLAFESRSEEVEMQGLG